MDLAFNLFYPDGLQPVGDWSRSECEYEGIGFGRIEN